LIEEKGCLPQEGFEPIPLEFSVQCLGIKPPGIAITWTLHFRSHYFRLYQFKKKSLSCTGIKRCK